MSAVAMRFRITARSSREYTSDWMLLDEAGQQAAADMNDQAVRGMVFETLNEQAAAGGLLYMPVDGTSQALHWHAVEAVSIDIDRSEAVQ